MRKLFLATAMTVVMAFGVSAAVKRFAPGALASTADPTIAMSIDELQRRIDARTLPVLDVDSFF